MPSNRPRRRTVLGTIVSIATLGISAAPAAASNGCADADSERPAALANRPDTWLAAVDRIVDDAHAVLLLEEDGDPVDQVVVSADEYPDLEEGDALLVTLEDDDPTEIHRLDEKTERRRNRAADRFDDLAEPLEG